MCIVSGSVGESSDQMVQGSVEDVNNIEDYKYVCFVIS